MRPVLWYLAFVGLPLLGLLAILRVGEQLQPPRAVHGRYAIAFDSSGRGPCLSPLVDSAAHTFTVSQSGPRVEIALGGLAFAGHVTGDSVRGAVVLSDKSAQRGSTCLTSDTIHVRAIVRRTGTDVKLPGEFSFPGCAACSSVPFRATRTSVGSEQTQH